MRITETDYGYEIKETVHGGYLTRSNYASYEITSKWNKELKFLDMEIDSDNWERLKNPNEFHYNRAIRAKNRHLKELKIHLEIEKPKEKEIKRKKIIWNSKYYNFDDRIRIGDYEETNKLFKGIVGTYNKNYMSYVEANEENIKIAEEFQRRYEEFECYRKETFKKLFGK